MKQFRHVLPIVVLLALIGCGQKKSDPVVKSPKPEPVIRPTDTKVQEPKVTPEDETEVAEEPQTPPAVPAAQIPLVVTAKEGTAEATFQQILIAFQDGKLDKVFAFLPSGHQSDLQDLVHQFAASMDAEIWTKTFAALKRSANLMKSKKSQFLKFELLKRSTQFAQIEASWDAIAGGILDVVNSDVVNLNELKQAELKGLLSSASQLLAGIPLPKFGNVDVSTVSADDQAATLAYRESKNGELKQVEFVKTDGKWLPKSLVNNWSDEMARMKSQLGKMSGTVASLKPRVVRTLDSVNEMLDGVETSKSQEDFDKAVVKLVFSVRLELLMALDAIQSASAIPRQEAAIRVEITRELSDDELTKLRDSIRSARDGDAVEYEMSAGDGKTRCRFTPITEPATLVGLLQKHFEGADVKLNSETQTIHVVWK